MNDAAAAGADDAGADGGAGAAGADDAGAAGADDTGADGGAGAATADAAVTIVAA